MIGIISYLPNDTELRATRVKNCRRQLEWLHKVLPNEVPYVVAQNYTEADMITDIEHYDVDVEYDMYEKGIGSHKARNVILKKFYASDDKWLLLMDDDVATYDYYDADTFIRNTYYNLYNIATDIIMPLQPESSPFKELNLKNKITQYYYLSRSAATNCPNMILFRHPDKEHEIFFDDTIDLLAEDAIPDDNKFVVECIHSGLRVHRADFWIKQSMDRRKSVIYATDKDTNFEQHARLGKNLANYVINTYKVKSVAEFNRLYNKAIPISIYRDGSYTIPENLLPERHTNAKKLF